MSVGIFEDLDVWKRACQQAVNVIKTTSELSPYALRDQLHRSAVSVPSNIAEGAERDTTPEFLRFLRIAKGSNGELRTQIYIAVRLEKITNTDSKALIDECREISKMLHGLIASLERKLPHKA